MEQKTQTVKIDISMLAVLKAVATLLSLWVAYQIREVFALLFVALIFATLIDPFAGLLASRKIPKALAVFLIYASIFLIVGLFARALIPPITNEFSALVKNFGSSVNQVFSQSERLHDLFSSLGGSPALEEGLQAFQGAFSGGLGSIFSGLRGALGSLAAGAVVLALTFYMVVEKNSALRFLQSITPPRYRDYFSEVLPEVQRKLGAWLRGQLMLGALIGVGVFIGLTALGVQYALTLALFSALAEFVPYVGPIIAAIPGIILAFSQSSWQGIATLILYYGVQWLENHFLVPKIMQKATGLNPIISISALLIGVKLGGVVGAVLAIPVAAALLAVAEDYFSREAKKISA